MKIKDSYISQGIWKYKVISGINHDQFTSINLGEQSNFIKILSDHDVYINFSETDIITSLGVTEHKYFLLKANSEIEIKNSNTQYIASCWFPFTTPDIIDNATLYISYFVNNQVFYN